MMANALWTSPIVAIDVHARLPGKGRTAVWVREKVMLLQYPVVSHWVISTFISPKYRKYNFLNQYPAYLRVSKHACVLSAR
jgi:hypothetical protein